MKNTLNTTFAIFLILFTFSNLALGQESQSGNVSEETVWTFVINNIVLLSAAAVIIFATFYLLKVGMSIMEIQYRQRLIDQGIDIPEPQKAAEQKYSWKSLVNKLTNLVPVSEESSIDLGHNYDGIRELDNRLPSWWLGLMYGSIIFAIGYLYYYHFSDTEWSSHLEYQEEVKKGDLVKEAYLFKMGNAINENNVEGLSDSENLAMGLELYQRNCIACHGNAGQGGVGPNLTDQYWVHGGSLKDIFRTIKYGVPEKGMIAWSNQLRPLNIQQVSSYILTLVGTNPPDQKAPEGELYEMSDTESPAQD